MRTVIFQRKSQWSSAVFFRLVTWRQRTKCKIVINMFDLSSDPFHWIFNSPEFYESCVLDASSLVSGPWTNSDRLLFNRKKAKIYNLLTIFHLFTDEQHVRTISWKCKCKLFQSRSRRCSTFNVNTRGLSVPRCISDEPRNCFGTFWYFGII